MTALPPSSRLDVDLGVLIAVLQQMTRDYADLFREFTDRLLALELLPPSNVRPLRPVPEETVTVRLPMVAWALVYRVLDQSDIPAVHEVAERIATQVRAAQAKRHPSNWKGPA